MKDLGIAVAVAFSAALVVLALAVYRTWTGEHMTMLARSASIACLVVPTITVAVATVIVVQRAVDHHFDTREEKLRAALDARARADTERAVQTIKVAEKQEHLSWRAARQESETLRAARLLAGLQAPQLAPPGISTNPWLLGDDEDEDA